ncbi:MAG: S41 family peptidase [Bacilli bacterium]|nr:S41 family peptidase [Bacilli bacterium]
MKDSEFKNIYKLYNPRLIKKDDYELIERLHFSFESFNKIRHSQAKKKVLTKEEALKDVESFLKLLEYCYSGYDYYKTMINFESIINNIIDYINKSKKITNYKLAKVIFEKLSIDLLDGHFQIYACKHSFCFYKPYYAYVTSIIVEEFDQKNFIVVKGNRKINKGSIISKDEILDKVLPTFPNNDKKRYFVGIISNQKTSNIVINNLRFKTHIIKSNFSNSKRKKYNCRLEEYDSYNLYYNNTYLCKEDNINIIQHFKNIGLKCRNKSINIWDIRGNMGGNSIYPKNYILGLNSYANWRCHFASINGIVFGNKQNKKTYEIIEAKEYEYDNATYDGTLYVLINKNVASSGESAVAYARSCKNAILVGSATAGVGMFGDVRLYQLENSKIIIQLPYKVFYDEDFKEGKGYIPDYWIDSKKPIKELMRYLNMKKIKMEESNE